MIKFSGGTINADGHRNTHLHSLGEEVWSEEERDEFVDWIALRKVRWSRSGMGKRSGARAIHFLRNDANEIVLVVVYAKAKLDNMPVEVLLQWKEAFHG